MNPNERLMKSLSSVLEQVLSYGPYSYLTAGTPIENAIKNDYMTMLYMAPKNWKDAILSFVNGSYDIAYLDGHMGSGKSSLLFKWAESIKTIDIVHVYLDLSQKGCLRQLSEDRFEECVRDKVIGKLLARMRYEAKVALEQELKFIDVDNLSGQDHRVSKHIADNRILTMAANSSVAMAYNITKNSDMYGELAKYIEQIGCAEDDLNYENILRSFSKSKNRESLTKTLYKLSCEDVIRVYKSIFKNSDTLVVAIDNFDALGTNGELITKLFDVINKFPSSVNGSLSSSNLGNLKMIVALRDYHADHSPTPIKSLPSVYHIKMRAVVRETTASNESYLQTEPGKIDNIVKSRINYAIDLHTDYFKDKARYIRRNELSPEEYEEAAAVYDQFISGAKADLFRIVEGYFDVLNESEVSGKKLSGAILFSNMFNYSYGLILRHLSKTIPKLFELKIKYHPVNIGKPTKYNWAKSIMLSNSDFNPALLELIADEIIDVINDNQDSYYCSLARIMITVLCNYHARGGIKLDKLREEVNDWIRKAEETEIKNILYTIYKGHHSLGELLKFKNTPIIPFTADLYEVDSRFEPKPRLLFMNDLYLPSIEFAGYVTNRMTGEEIYSKSIAILSLPDAEKLLGGIYSNFINPLFEKHKEGIRYIWTHYKNESGGAPMGAVSAFMESALCHSDGFYIRRLVDSFLRTTKGYYTQTICGSESSLFIKPSRKKIYDNLIDYMLSSSGSVDFKHAVANMKNNKYSTQNLREYAFVTDTLKEKRGELARESKKWVEVVDSLDNLCNVMKKANEIIKQCDDPNGLVSDA